MNVEREGLKNISEGDFESFENRFRICKGLILIIFVIIFLSIKNVNFAREHSLSPPRDDPNWIFTLFEQIFESEMRKGVYANQL